MRGFIVILFLALGFQAHAAHLNCQLGTPNQTLVTQSHVISEDYDLSTVMFNMPLDYQNIHANVFYDYKLVELSIRSNEGETYQHIDHWTEPLEQRFVVTGSMKLNDQVQNVYLNCSVDVSDNRSSNWAKFKSDMDDNVRRINMKLDRIKALAAVQVASPEESLKLNNGICLVIGALIGGSEYAKVRESVIRLSSLPRFTDIINVFNEQAYGKLTNLGSFCAQGLTPNPQPLPEGDRNVLIQRIPEAKEGLNNVIRFLESRFPNQESPRH